MTEPKDQRPLGLHELIGSVLAAALGVQSAKNRARDFSRGKASHFIVVGLAATFMFALALFGLVQLVLHVASR